MTGSVAEIVASSLPIAIILFTILAIVGIVAYFEHKKNMAMIEKGLIPDNKYEKGKKEHPENKLLWGISAIGTGISLLIAKMFNLDNNFIVGMMFVSVGIGFLVAFLVAILWKRRELNE